MVVTGATPISEETRVPVPLFLLNVAQPRARGVGAKVVVGSVISILGACAVAINTDLPIGVLGVTDTLAPLFHWRVN